ncbi:MAG: LacI family transcriptional regulator [Rhodobacteraceae bacterium]|nr:LacI family transcriptional regulator [Paracoccaceae bacterium]
MGKPTLRTISEVTGLALTTISRALSEDPKIAPATRERVARVAREVGYVPDRAAQRLRTGRTNVIAIVLSPHEEIIGFRGSLIAGLGEALEGTAFHISMIPYATGNSVMAPVAHIVRNRLADGLVFAGTSPDDPRARYLSEAGFPFASHGRTGFGNGHAWCDYDNAAFARIAVERLAGRGRRRPFLIQPAAEYTFATHMTTGFSEAAARAGIAALLDPAVTIRTPADRINAFVTDLMASPGAPDAFICPGEVAAMAVLAALTDLGLRVGRDVDVIAKQTSPLFDQFRPRIDTIYEDLRAAGKVLGSLLLRRIAGEPPEALNVLMQPAPRFRL